MRYRRVFIAGGSYFFTLVTDRRAPLFGDADTVRLYREATARVQVKRPFTIEAEVILPDHLHALWTLPDGDHDYPTRVHLVKSAFTKSYIAKRPAAAPSASRQAKREQAVWQRRYWEHTIRDEADFNRHVDYIHGNPVHHGFVGAARDWPHSTFRSWVDRGVYRLDWSETSAPEIGSILGDA